MEVYKANTLQMIQTATHSDIVGVVDSLYRKGLSELMELEREPVMTGFFRK